MTDKQKVDALITEFAPYAREEEDALSLIYRTTYQADEARLSGEERERFVGAMYDEWRNARDDEAKS